MKSSAVSKSTRAGLPGGAGRLAARVLMAGLPGVFRFSSGLGVVYPKVRSADGTHVDQVPRWSGRRRRMLCSAPLAQFEVYLGFDRADVTEKLRGFAV